MKVQSSATWVPRENILLSVDTGKWVALRNAGGTVWDPEQKESMPNQFRLSHAFPSTPPSSTPPPSVPPSLPGSENGDEDGPEEATFDENAPPVIRDGSREDPSDEESQTLESSTATPVPPTPAPSQPSFPLTRHSLTVLARLSWRQWHRRVWSCLIDVRAVLVVSAHGVIRPWQHSQRP